MAAIVRSQLPRELLAIIQQPLHHYSILPASPTRTVLSSQHARQALLRRANLSTSSRLRASSEQSPPPPQSSVDPTEIAHFNALASSWWDPYGPSRLLHLMNPLRHRFIDSCLGCEPAPGAASRRPLHYLDVGCGGGIFAESAARLRSTASVTAIDPSPDVLAVALAHRRHDPLLARPGRLCYHNTTLEGLAAGGAAPPQPRGGYDVVTLFEVLEHVAHPAEFLAAAAAQLRPGGWLVASTIARTFASWFVTNLVAEDVLRMVPRGTHDWNKYIHERELREWFLQRGGWNSPRSVGVMYVPGLGWREVPFKGGEGIGNYFFGIRKDE